MLILNFVFVGVLCVSNRKEGQDTQDELQKKNLREELEERERKHYSSKDKPYSCMISSTHFLVPFWGVGGGEWVSLFVNFLIIQ